MVRRNIVCFLAASFVCGVAFTQQIVIRKEKPLNEKKTQKVMAHFNFAPKNYKIISGKQVKGHRMRGAYEYSMRAEGAHALRLNGMYASSPSLYTEFSYVYITFLDVLSDKHRRIMCIDKYKRCRIILR